MKQKRLQVRDKKLKKIITSEGRKGAKKDFFELLARAISSNKN